MANIDDSGIESDTDGDFDDTDPIDLKQYTQIINRGKDNSSFKSVVGLPISNCTYDLYSCQLMTSCGKIDQNRQPCSLRK